MFVFRLLRWSFLYSIFPKSDSAISRCFQKYLQKGDVVFDIGGNCGHTALEISAIIGRKGRVFSFEPNPEMFKKCKLIEKYNFLQNIKFYNFGIGRSNKCIPFFIDTRQASQGSSFDGLFVKSESALRGDNFFLETEAQIRKLDDLKIPPPNFIKIDVEGFELEVLNGALDTIEKYRPIIVFEFYFDDTATEYRNRKLKLVKFFNGLKYKLEIIEVWRDNATEEELGNYLSVGCHFGGYTGCDLIAIPL